jgi:hypothetical protein
VSADLPPEDAARLREFRKRSIERLGELPPSPERDGAIRALTAQLEQSAPKSNVLAFPERNKGRKRRSASIDAAGKLSLLLLERDGETVSEKVQLIEEPNGPECPPKSPELLFSILIWGALSAEQRESVKATARRMAYDGQADPCALQLHNMLSKKCPVQTEAR